MEVVPGSNDLVIEARVPTYLIGKIKQGMQANLRFVAFVQRNTPVLQGEVILVGADKVASDKIGDPSHSAEANRAEYYLVRIAIKDDLAEKLPGKTLQPGMPVDVVVKGGRAVIHDLPAQAADRSKWRWPSNIEIVHEIVDSSYVGELVGWGPDAPGATGLVHRSGVRFPEGDAIRSPLPGGGR